MSSRSRNWTFIAYPDSAPSDWIESLDRCHIEFAVSPLHDKDLKNETEPEEKKAHWHVILKFQGNKSYEQVKDLINYCNGTSPQIVQSVPKLLAYFIHKNHPQKYQYDIKDIILHGAFDLSPLLLPSPDEQMNILNAIYAFIDENKIYEFKLLADYCRINDLKDWSFVLNRSCTIPIRTYLASFRHMTFAKDGESNA